ncbi:MAG: alpha/beta hydrolase [Opitutales bacterium]|nr:alpha/beta hydrolase [Opitutales bacterium]
MDIHHFPHQFVSGDPKGSVPNLLLLHGMGGSEHDLIQLAQELSPGSALLSPRGQISERGAARFFKRFAEGVLDIDDWRFRSAELAEWLQLAKDAYDLKGLPLYALGYSNGANIALGLLLLQPEVISGAVLLRPMWITDEVPGTTLTGQRVLLLSGAEDPIIDADDAAKLEAQFKALGASVSMHQHERVGHQLVRRDLELAKEWLASS